MTLTIDLTRVCRRLAAHAWSVLLAAHGLDLAARDLARARHRRPPVPLHRGRRRAVVRRGGRWHLARVKTT